MQFDDANSWKSAMVLPICRYPQAHAEKTKKKTKYYFPSNGLRSFAYRWLFSWYMNIVRCLAAIWCEIYSLSASHLVSKLGVSERGKAFSCVQNIAHGGYAILCHSNLSPRSLLPLRWCFLQPCCTCRSIHQANANSFFYLTFICLVFSTNSRPQQLPNKANAIQMRNIFCVLSSNMSKFIGQVKKIRTPMLYQWHNSIQHRNGNNIYE